jgi:hypothetical protein
MPACPPGCERRRHFLGSSWCAADVLRSLPDVDGTPLGGTHVGTGHGIASFLTVNAQVRRLRMTRSGSYHELHDTTAFGDGHLPGRP